MPKKWQPMRPNNDKFPITLLACVKGQPLRGEEISNIYQDYISPFNSLNSIYHGYQAESKCHLTLSCTFVCCMKLKWFTYILLKNCVNQFHQEEKLSLKYLTSNTLESIIMTTPSRFFRSW